MTAICPAPLFELKSNLLIRAGLFLFVQRPAGPDRNWSGLMCALHTSVTRYGFWQYRVLGKNDRDAIIVITIVRSVVVPVVVVDVAITKTALPTSPAQNYNGPQVFAASAMYRHATRGHTNCSPNAQSYLSCMLQLFEGRRSQTVFL